MGVPLRQQLTVASYLMKQKLNGAKKYPLVLMLEPLFRCNLACAGCGKIDYPDEIPWTSACLLKNVCRRWMNVTPRWFQFRAANL